MKTLLKYTINQGKPGKENDLFYQLFSYWIPLRFDFRLCARASDIVTLHVTKFFVGSISMGRLYNFQGEALKL